MTDSEAMEFCESRLKRLEELKKLRKNIERRKPSEANRAAWRSVKDEVMSICNEAEEKLVIPEYRPEDIKVTMLVCELMTETMKAMRSCVLRR
ncbi:MAG: hypothetical protein LUD51_01380 [Clostridia bacterium]|nr:hypothetical protein [Clostridia bacterium]